MCHRQIWARSEANMNWIDWVIPLRVNEWWIWSIEDWVNESGSKWAGQRDRRGSRVGEALFMCKWSPVEDAIFNSTAGIVGAKHSHSEQSNSRRIISLRARSKAAERSTGIPWQRFPSFSSCPDPRATRR